jgi:TetR/AcrR family transcriptional regulator of autoinduction and epiphytic fitness
MDRIVASAGVSKRTVYNHFPSKEELFAQILRQLWESSLASPQLAYRADRALRPQLLELVQQKRQLLYDEAFIDLARVAIAAVIPSPNARRRCLRAWATRRKASRRGSARRRRPVA